MDVSEAASIMSRSRKVVVKKCRVCKKSFRCYKRGLYCSNSCKMKAKYRRKKARIAQQGNDIKKLEGVKAFKITDLLESNPPQ